MVPSVFVDPGALRLDRPGLVLPAPRSPDELREWSARWAAEVGWSLADSVWDADAVVLGPGAEAPPAGQPAVHAVRGRGVDGIRWALRHIAFWREWPGEVVRYGGHAEQVMDVRRGGAPVAVLVHGGFWLQAWQRDLMDGVAVDLARRGWTTCNVEYRRVGTGGGWPETGEDVATAVRFARERLGATDTPLLVVGHSAGAQLALEAARQVPVDGVVCLAGVLDLVDAQRDGVGGGAVDTFLGTHAPEEASPLHHLPLGVRVLAAHDPDDPLVPVEQSRRFVAEARACAEPAELLEVAGAGHFGLIEPEAAWTRVVAHPLLAEG